MTTFNEMSVQLCEGQQLDVDFESRDNVEIDEYIHMITYKTSVLIAAAMKMAAQYAGASQEDQEHIYQFGKNIGIAFQMQDDILDSFGEKAAVGKRIGGDILEGKKTYLYIKALELSDDSQKTKLISLMNDPHIEDQRKIDDVLNIFKATHVRVYADQLKEAYRDLAFSHLAELKINESDRVELKEFGQYLLDRTV
jgi:geranylgeranyl diphosphate synthase type II